MRIRIVLDQLEVVLTHVELRHASGGGQWPHQRVLVLSSSTDATAPAVSWNVHQSKNGVDG